MIQDIPAEESLLALVVADPTLSISDEFAPEILTDHRQELGRLVAKIKIERGVPGYETLRSLGATEECLKLFDVVFHDETDESFPHLCKHLRKIATTRRIHLTCKKFHKQVMEPDCNPEEMLPGLESEVMGLRDLLNGRESNGGPRRGGDVGPLVRMLENTLSRKGKVMGLRTGFREVDAAFDGLNPGRLYLIGARPSVGKTSLLLSIAKNLLDGLDESQGPERGMIFTLEMPFDDIMMNLLVIKSLYSREYMQRGMVKEHLINLRRHVEEMASWDWEIDDTGAIEIDLLCHRARKAHSERPLRWVGVDYLQLIRGSKKANQSRQIEIGEVSSKLKALAKELSIPVIALAQLKRQERILDKDKGSKVSPRPRLEDLRESGDLEQDADGVALIHRDLEAEDSFAEIIIAKNRFGALHHGIPVLFEKELSRYKPKPI